MFNSKLLFMFIELTFYLFLVSTIRSVGVLRFPECPHFQSTTIYPWKNCQIWEYPSPMFRQTSIIQCSFYVPLYSINFNSYPKKTVNDWFCPYAASFINHHVIILARTEFPPVKSCQQKCKLCVPQKCLPQKNLLPTYFIPRTWLTVSMAIFRYPANKVWPDFTYPTNKVFFKRVS